jgi:hypothetical protein
MRRFVENARMLWERRNDSHELEEHCRRYVKRHHSPAVIATQWMNALGLSTEREH